MAIASLLSSFSSSVREAPLAFSLGASIVLLTLAWCWAKDELPYSGFPVVGKEKGEWLNTKAKMRYVMNANTILKQGLEKYKRPFQILASHGPVIVLPPTMTDEIRNDDRLSFLKSAQTLFLPQYPGLEIFHNDIETHKIVLTVIKQSLTQSLNSMTPILAAEIHSTLQTLLPLPATTKDSTSTFTPIRLATLTPTMAARLSARAFLGAPLCHDPAWLDISVTYAINALGAVQALRSWPAFLRPLVHKWFVPQLRVLREQIATARGIVGPEMRKRRAERAERAKRRGVEGEKEEGGGGGGEGAAARPMDALEWMAVQAEREGRADVFDATLAQVLLSFVSIHTTSGTLLGLMYDVVGAGWADALRSEVVDVLREEGGWSKNALYRMKLMDSCLKESQRLHPMNSLFMNREVTAPVTLSDGTRLPVGAIIGIPTFPMHDPDTALYDNPGVFDGARFLKLRETDNDTKWQFVTTSPEHFGFGHGKQACPGRFFASNEIKIIMAHLLLMFDWKFEAGDEPKKLSLVECEFVPDVEQKIWVKPRVPEVDLGAF
ncbi:cytochrome p450 [Diplodia corticola]|uniref:Cytochrome p450 n=1 Tax=Diplodia corticola TaxID=236234 RepID=A0A1J9S8S6_9PEZI|nr:cytochrome p450 [Diplodia corticola]OJD35989.1 cytochrome p450 [Diplodia corticola]